MDTSTNHHNKGASTDLALQLKDFPGQMIDISESHDSINFEQTTSENQSMEVVVSKFSIVGL